MLGYSGEQNRQVLIRNLKFDVGLGMGVGRLETMITQACGKLQTMMRFVGRKIPGTSESI